MTSATTTAYQLCTSCAVAVAYTVFTALDTDSAAQVLAFMAETGYLVPADDIDPPPGNGRAKPAESTSSARAAPSPTTNPPDQSKGHPNMNAWIATKDPAKVNELADLIAAHEPHRITDADDDREFAVWMYEVDRAIRERTDRFGHRDLPDWGWRDAYTNDLSPTDAAADAITHWEQFGDL